MKKHNVLFGALAVFAGVSLIVGVVMPVGVRGRQLALGAICRANLSGIGRAMLIYNIEPPDGATGVSTTVQLTWTAGAGAILHDVYFGTDEAAVALGDATTFQGRQPETSFDPGVLETNTTYYWRVDEFNAPGAVVPGEVYSFTTRRFSPVG